MSDKAITSEEEGPFRWGLYAKQTATLIKDGLTR